MVDTGRLSRWTPDALLPNRLRFGSAPEEERLISRHVACLAGMPVLACPRCGSRELSPGRWFIGPAEYMHEPVDTAICGRCGYRGMALTFRDSRAAEKYARSLTGEEAAGP